MFISDEFIQFKLVVVSLVITYQLILDISTLNCCILKAR